MNKKLYLPILTIVVAFASCKKENSTSGISGYFVPSTYSFTDASGNNTVNYSGQTERLNQLSEMMLYAESAETSVISAQVLKDMFANTNGNGNGAFSFSSSKQLKNKCFSLDTALIISYFDELATASASFSSTASSGQAGTLSSGSSVYLFAANGFEYAEVIEKSIMGAVIEYQALNHYFASAQMSVDNTTAVDPANGAYYTQLEHHWDEAFGYFGVPLDFPTSLPSEFWGKYCNSANVAIGSNDVMMDNFLKGRAAIVNDKTADRDAAIYQIRTMWEKIAAQKAMDYLDQAATNFGTDQAKTLHVLSEAYGFIYCLRFAPIETRVMSTAEVETTLNMFGSNLWNLSLSDIQAIKAVVNSYY